MRYRVFGGVVAALMLAALPVSALDQRFTDADGDMVADTPKDAKQVIDPPVLIFSYTPVEDPAMYAKVWDGFVRHMEKVTGKRVTFAYFPWNWDRGDGCIVRLVAILDPKQKFRIEKGSKF